MAGIRKKALPNGKFQGWYFDANKKRVWFVGTDNLKETREMARSIESEHFKVRVGYIPAPKSWSKHSKRDYSEIAKEYLAHGKSKGGRHGKPWDDEYADKMSKALTWWQKRLTLETLADCADCLPRVESALRDLQTADDLAGKTLNTRAGYLKSFFEWCSERGYLELNPLDGLTPYDSTPLTERRALTPNEIEKFLRSIEEKGTVYAKRRRIGYELALASGLRADELRSLQVKHLDVERSGLVLDAAWTKNRNAGFQPLPAVLMEKLKAAIQGKPETDPLCFVSQDAASALKADLERAGLKQWGPGGKVDFHALRVAYVSYVVESGANIKEAQTLARHANPALTLKIYAKARSERLSEVTEQIGKVVLPGMEREAQAALKTGTDDIPVKPMETRSATAKCVTGVQFQNRDSCKDSESTALNECPGEELNVIGANSCSAHKTNDATQNTDLPLSVLNLVKSPHVQHSQTTKHHSTQSEPNFTHHKSENVQPVCTYSVPSDLQTVMDAWPALPDALRAGILAMVNAARK